VTDGVLINSSAAKLAEECGLHEVKLAKMETEMKVVVQQEVAEKEAKFKQSEEEVYPPPRNEGGARVSAHRSGGQEATPGAQAAVDAGGQGHGENLAIWKGNMADMSPL